jgi:hypothetical protein
MSGNSSANLYYRPEIGFSWDLPGPRNTWLKYMLGSWGLDGRLIARTCSFAALSAAHLRFSMDVCRCTPSRRPSIRLPERRIIFGHSSSFAALICSVNCVRNASVCADTANPAFTPLIASEASRDPQSHLGSPKLYTSTKFLGPSPAAATPHSLLRVIADGLRARRKDLWRPLRAH